MPLSVWNKLFLPDLTPTCITLELADRLIYLPVGVAEDVYVKVGSFHFLVDFVVVDFDDDPRVPLILERSFLKTERALIDVFEGNYLPEVRKELKIREAKSDKSSIDEPPEVELKDLPPHLEYAFLEDDDKFPVIIAKYISVEEKTALITGGFIVVENEENELIPTRLVTGWRVCIDYRKLNESTRKDHFPLPFMDHMLERLAGNQYYCFLDGFSGYFQIPIDPKDQEKTTLTCPYGTFAYRRMPFGLCNAPDTFQSCLFHLEMMLKRCEDTNLCLNWEKIHFMVKEECVEAFQTLKRKLTGAPILIAPDWDMPFELMCDASDFAIGAVLGQRQDKHFRPIKYASKTMTEAESNYTITEKEMLAVVYAFEKFQFYLIMNKSIVYTDHSALKYLFAKKDSKARLLRWVLLLQEFAFKEKTKRLHDSKIKDRVVNIGDRVLFFNSRLKIFSGKLKSRWSGLFTIFYVYPYGTVELSQPDGPNFKVNGHRLKHYFGEDVPNVLQSCGSCVVGLLAVIDSEFELRAWSCELTSFWPAAATVKIPAAVLAVLKPERLKADRARN
nr:DNA-directed DNA polymerase [Tanacetum cinerariifolium]